MKKLTKKELKARKQVQVIRELYPIKNADFIEKIKKQVVSLYGVDALNELIITDKTVEFRGNKVDLVDENKPIETIEGLVIFHSTNYNFQSGVISSWGEITNIETTSNGWIYPCFNGNRYVYTIKEA